MKRLILLTCIASLLATGISRAQTWTALASDGTGDGAAPGLLDGTKLEYRYDGIKDSIWFRVTVNSIKTSAYGLNIILNADSGGATANWFGQNTSFAYNRILTVWISSGASGTVGITDAAGFAGGNYTKIGSNNLSYTIDAANKAYIIGVKRTDILNAGRLKAKVIAAVGSDMNWNDDIPNSGSGNIDVQPGGTFVSNLNQGYPDILMYPNPANNKLNISFASGVSSGTMISICNMQGQKVFTKTLGNNDADMQINLQGLAKGLYTVHIQNGNEAVNKLLTIE